MRDGFLTVAAGTPEIRVADCAYNAGQIIALMQEAAGRGVGGKGVGKNQGDRRQS